MFRREDLERETYIVNEQKPKVREMIVWDTETCGYLRLC